MKSLLSRVRRPAVGALAAAATLVLVAGCGTRENFAKVNGQVISHDEYVRALERAPVQVTGGAQPVQMNAGRYVLDQLVGRKLVMAEASKLGVMPTDEEVQQRLEVQKRIFEQQVPGKTFEEAMKEQGTTEADLVEEMRFQMAETNVLAAQMNVEDSELQSFYAETSEQMGFPERVQLRVIQVEANSQDFNQAQKMLADNTEFEQVARQVNAPEFRGEAGLLRQPFPVESLPEEWQAKARAPQGTVFGPVEWPAVPGDSPRVAWVRVERHMPAFTLTYDEARPFIKQQVVHQKILEPQHSNVREAMMNLKMDANFQAADPRYNTMWEATKEAARDAGFGRDTHAHAPVTAVPAPQ